MSDNTGRRTGLVRQFTRKVRNLPLHYREKGFSNFTKHLLGRIIAYGKYAVFVRDLSEAIEEVPAKIPLNVRMLRRDDAEIDRIARFWPAMYAPGFSTVQDIKGIIARRLAAGEECLIAEYQGEIAHMNWIGFQKTGLFNPFARKRGVGADEALSYNTYCAPEYRGNNIMAAVHSQMLNLVKSRGYKKMCGYVLPHNAASMKVSTRLFGEPKQTLHFLTILGFTFYFLLRKIK